MVHSNFFPINFRCLGSGQTWLQRGSFGSCNWNEYNLNPLTRNNWRASLVPAAAVIPAPIAYIKVVAVKKLVVGSVSSRRRTTERGRLASRLAFLQVIVPGVSAGRPAGRRIRAVVVGRVRSARASTAARLGAPGLSFRRWRRALGTSERDRRQNIVRVVVASPLRRGACVRRGRAGTFTLNKLECSKQAR
ncbi:hypothetical protein V9T40_013483 [Parthenolecanium corni]|uniref:Uncharacterized protein n=1 Tax=Parthenolecanium corni TaxID=536013 RepID=A0AAN9T2X2_9HEMI